MNARRFNFLSFVTGILTAAVYCAAAEDTPKAGAGPLPLWKVEGAKSTVYLLGSIHFLKADHYPLAAPIESAYSNAEVAVFETDLEKMESPETMMKMMSRSQLPEGETMRGVLPMDVYTNFLSHAAAAGLPPMMFDQLVPSMAAATVVAMEVQKLGFDPEYGVDNHFFTLAKRDSKEIVPLETVDFQIDLITDFSKDEAALLVKSMLDEFDSVKDEIRALVAAWESGDADKLEKYLNEVDRQSPKIFKRLVTDRNERWVPEIEKLTLGDKQAIVIVGAGHLVGPDGVVSLLKKNGLKVTQLSRAGQ